MTKLKYGVVGLGIGKAHVEALSRLDQVELVAVADISEQAVREVAGTTGARGYTDPVEMLEKEGLSAVSICTPPGSHLELTRAAARAGTHVLCEKPMAPSVEHCDGMVRACKDAGVVLMIGQKKRFHPLVQRTKQLCETEIGQIRWAVVKYALGKVPKPWFWEEDDGGGPILENSIHTIDELRYLMGEVATVYAEGDNLFMPEFKP